MYIGGMVNLYTLQKTGREASAMRIKTYTDVTVLFGSYNMVYVAWTMQLPEGGLKFFSFRFKAMDIRCACQALNNVFESWSDCDQSMRARAIRKGAK